jgi:Domain of unknown function (DUF1737)
MSKVKEYKVVSAVGTIAINEAVASEISDGWQPFGSVTSVWFEAPKLVDENTITGFQYAQAMVKYE